MMPSAGARKLHFADFRSSSFAFNLAESRSNIRSAQLADVARRPCRRAARMAGLMTPIKLYSFKSDSASASLSLATSRCALRKLDPLCLMPDLIREC